MTRGVARCTSGFVSENEGMRKSIGIWYLLAAMVVAVIFLIAVVAGADREENRYAQLQLSAAKTMAAAEEYMRQMMLEKGIEPEPEDLNKMLLLGPEFTELTSTPGSDDAKRTSLNPNFAAAMVRYYNEAGLKKGDVVAVGTSGSFPGLAIATIIAASQMGLKTRVIASLGASMHGATRVEYNIFDIILALKEGGFADFDLIGVSRGSANDQGGGVLEGMFYEGSAELSRQICADVAARTGAEFIQINSMAENIRHRFELFGDDVDLFVNVGGASVNEGTSSVSLTLPAGLAMTFQDIPKGDTRGLVFEYLERGIPIINLLNVKQLAADNGITFDPVPMSKPGDGGVYSKSQYSIVLIISGIACTLAVLVFGMIMTVRKRSR